MVEYIIVLDFIAQKEVVAPRGVIASLFWVFLPDLQVDSVVWWITQCRKMLESVDRAVCTTIRRCLRFCVVIFSSASLKSDI